MLKELCELKTNLLHPLLMDFSLKRLKAMKQIKHKLFVCIISSVLILALATVANSNGEDTWRPVDPNELAQKESKVEKGADAEAIFWDESFDIGGFFEPTTTKIHIRVKIFSERGRDRFSKIEAEYDSYSKIENLAARVIKPDGSIVEIKKNEIFEKTIVKASGTKIKAKIFIVPNLEVGSILEYRYTKISPFTLYSLQLFFQRDIPAQSITNCAVAKSLFGGKMDTRNSIIFNMEKIDFVEKDGMYCGTKKNVATFKTEPMMPPENSVKPWVLFIGEKTKDKKDDSSDTQKMKIWFLKNLKDRTKPNEAIKKTALQIIGDAQTDGDKLTRLFEFCKMQIKNTDYDYSPNAKKEESKKRDIFYIRKASETLKEKEGTSTNINDLFASLALAVGLDVRFVMTGDRNSAMLLSNNKENVDIVFSFNTTPCIGVVVGDYAFYFSPGNYYLPMGMLPWNIEGQKSMLVNEKIGNWHKTPLTPPEANAEKRSGKFRLSEDGTLEGEIKMEFTGHIGQNYKLANDELTQAEREQSLTEKVKRISTLAELSNIKIENAQDPVKNFIYAFNVRILNYAQRTGKRIFFQPNFFEYNSEPLFVSNMRTHQIFFPYAWSVEVEIEIELPQNFELEVETAPRVASFSHVGGNYTIYLTPSDDGKILTYKSTFKFGTNKQLLYEVSAYPLMKTFFDNIHKKATQIVTLKQK
jgi:hypothetical protein